MSSASAGGFGPDVPTWNGDPVEFESFATSCRWFEKSLKETEKKAAASKVWARLVGPAKSVVKHLNPDEYENETGLSRLVEVLRNSPLQQLPVPDLFKRLDQWHQLSRQGAETIPQYLVREEDVFTQVQDALKRARLENNKASQLVSGSVPVMEQRGPPSTPSQSPTGAAPAARVPVPPQEPQQSMVKDFFEDELRGYRVLKGAGLTNAERQNILVQTNNTTNYMTVRRALRTLFADDDDSWRRRQRVWWNQDVSGEWGGDEWLDGADDSGTYAWWYDDESTAQSNDWSDYDWNSGGDWTSWNMYYDGWDESEWHDDAMEDLPCDESSNDPMEQQYKEAYALANEAQRTLAEAREAVKKVRQARGYFAPESASGKGISGSPSHGRSFGSPSSSGSGKGKTLGRGKGKFFGPCFICGMHGHSYNQCPDRFAKGKGRFGFGKGSPKGKKGKSKGKKGPFKSVQFHDLSFVSSPGIYLAEAAQSNRVILDTGASENAVGMESLSRLISSSNVKYAVDVNDKPIFRFGNGQQLRASSRVDLQETSLGMVSFYVLGDEACLTPPLMGGKTLREINAVMAYQNNLLLYQRQGPQSPWFAVKMHPHSSHHVSIDLMEPAIPMKEPGMWFLHGGDEGSFSDQHGAVASAVEDLSASVTWLKDYKDCVRRLRMTSRQPPCAEDDPRVKGFPCHGVHHPKQRQNQHATWATCATCGLRLSYQSKKNQDGAYRHMGPHPNLMKLALKEIKKEMGADQVTEKIVNGKLMELKGIQLQKGLTETMCINMSLSDYMKRMGYQPDTNDAPENVQATTTAKGKVIGQTDLIMMAAENYLRANGLNDLDPEAFQKHVMEFATGKTLEEIQEAKRQLDAKKRPTEVIDIASDAEEDQDWMAVKKEADASAPWGSLMMLRQKMRGTGTTCHQGSQSDVNGDPMSAGAYGFKGRQHMSDQHGLHVTAGVGQCNFQGGLPAHGLDPGANGFQGSLPDQTSIESQLPQSGPGGGKKRGVQPHTAKKLATNVAILSAMVMTPFRSLMSQISNDVDFAEIACAPTSSLSASVEELGYNIQRINYKEGYDLDRKSGTQKVGVFMKEKKPRHTWVSLPCTRLTSLVNLAQRDEFEEAAFQKRQGRDLKRAEEIAETLEEPLSCGDDVSWEWPTTAKKGWNSKAIAKLQAIAQRHHRHLYWCHFHGCAYGLTFKGFPVMKGWTVITTCREVWLSLQKRCPGHTDHIHCRGQVAQASAYYPVAMVKAVTKAISASWNRQEDRAGTSLGRDLGLYLLDAKDEISSIDNMTGGSIGFEEYTSRHWEQEARDQDPHVFALTRKRYPDQMPKGKQLEQIKSQMLRVHKAAGHPSMANLQKLLRARQAPQ
eukprot:s1426_g6.t1